MPKGKKMSNKLRKEKQKQKKAAEDEKLQCKSKGKKLAFRRRRQITRQRQRLRQTVYNYASLYHSQAETDLSPQTGQNPSIFYSDYVSGDENYYSFEEPMHNRVSDLMAGVLMRPGYESYRDYGNVYNPYINALWTNRNTTSFEVNFEQQPDNQSYYYNMSNWNQYTTALMTRMDSSYSNFEERCFTVTKLDTSSAEYNLIWKYFEGHYYVSLEICKIQNTALNIQFDLRLEQLRARGEKPQTYFLLHDTKYDNVNSICQNNFDEKKGRRFEFGPGVYFSTRADDAFRRSSYKSNFIRAMFLVDVIVNKTVCAKKCTPNVTSGEYDTLICHRGTTYRKNDKSEYVPRYVAIYWRR